MSEIKTDLTDSQPKYVLKILVNLSPNIILHKQILLKKKKNATYFAFGYLETTKLQCG